jgi:hypothetical protein
MIGRIAVWAWLANPSEHEFTKDLDIAVSRAALRKIRDWLQAHGYKTHELRIGGVNVADRTVNVDFIERSQDGDLSALFADAVKQAVRRGLVVDTESGEKLPIAPPEYIVAMKLATGELKDERDARRILESVPLEMARVRALVAKHLGVGAKNRLEVILRELGHSAARRAYKDGASE